METLETIKELWLNTDLSQASIAEYVGVTHDSLSRVVIKCFSKDQRAERSARVRAAAQHHQRVPTPDWYKGGGRSVPLSILTYCELHSMTKIPDGTTVIFRDGDVTNYSLDNLMLMTLDAAKVLAEIRNIKLARKFLDDIRFNARQLPSAGGETGDQTPSIPPPSNE